MAQLHPSLHDPARRAALRASWTATQRLRLAPLLTEASATAALAALRQQPFQLNATPDGALHHLYWHAFFQPDHADPVLAALARCLRTDLCALVADISGRPLAPTRTGQSVSTLYSYGCYLDIHNDGGNGRSVAFVVGLTPGRWPAAEGGSLEFLAVDGDGDGVRVAERRPPGWNTLDLFDVASAPLHRIPMVTGHHERRACSGWFYAPGAQKEL